MEPEDRLFLPGATFEISNAAELRDVEAAIIGEVDPLMSATEEEMNRLSLEDQGSLRLFKLSRDTVAEVLPLHGEVINNAYEVACNPISYGWKTVGRSPYKTDATGNVGRFTVGLVISGQLPSGWLAKKAVWYVPSTTNFHVRRGKTDRSNSYQTTVRRYESYAKPIN